MKQIAFIGLGHMGAPMATNLLKAGYLLNVFDLVQSAVDGLVLSLIHISEPTRHL
ncbi:hypothetical protein KZ844_30440, partial [Pseudomonas aeruginosa]|uniref:NAD(P)-binding domain-containing protein n=1 Tax=Pseudomonas aeruginosa TaxID=287 RepID=UPI0021564676